MNISCKIVTIAPELNLPIHLLAFANFFFDNELEVHGILKAPRTDGDKFRLEFPSANGKNKLKLIRIRDGKLYQQMLSMAKREYERQKLNEN